MRQLIKNILLVIAPSIIKKRVFGHYELLSWENLSVLEFDAELMLLEFLVHKNSVFFDIGANKGEYVYYAENFIESKHIYVFEPQKKLYKQLKAVFKNAQVFDVALSDKKGIHLLKTPIINGHADNCLSSLEVKHIEDNEEDAIEYEVKTDTLDAFTVSYQVFPDLIKIDVEGHELSVLKGAENYILKHHPTLIIEIEQRHHADINIDLVFKSFSEQGYQAYYYSKKKSQLFSYLDKTNLTNSKDYFGKIDYINNYIFIHTSNTSIKSIDAMNKAISQKIKA